MDMDAVHGLLQQMLETELAGERIYETAIENAVNDDLREEWEGYLDETRTHQQLVTTMLDAAGVDSDEDDPGRRIIRAKGDALVSAMVDARGIGERQAELVAAECVVEAESKDHQNWELLGRVAEKLDGKLAEVAKDAYAEAGEQEAEHFFHTKGWARELWIQHLGLPAALPPPEEEKSVTTEIGAGRAEHARGEYISS